MTPICWVRNRIDKKRKAKTRHKAYTKEIEPTAQGKYANGIRNYNLLLENY